MCNHGNVMTRLFNIKRVVVSCVAKCCCVCSLVTEQKCYILTEAVATFLSS